MNVSRPYNAREPDHDTPNATVDKTARAELPERIPTMSETARVAYFSMEIALESSMPTYSGGLGVLAGDTIRSAADLEVPMVAVSLLHRQGYFYQRLDAQGRQSEEPVVWSVDDFLESLPERASVEIEGRSVQIRAWRYRVQGVTGFQVPVYLLDTNLSDNRPQDRQLTDALYAGDSAYRLSQEVVLGIGGIRILRALGYHQIVRFHMNEGHSALLVLALFAERLAAAGPAAVVNAEMIEAVRRQCVFTTHTPVPAGHDQFPNELVQRILGTSPCEWLQVCDQAGGLNMTDLALRNAQFVNGVAMRHGEVSRGMFPGYPIHCITNGVHPTTWTAPALQALYHRYLPGWQRDALLLRYAIDIPCAAIWEAHQAAKRALIGYINRDTNAGFDRDVLTLGFARRATAYKRALLIFKDLERLRAIAQQVGPLQLVFAGKAHPRDEEGKAVIRQLHAARDALRGVVAVVYLPNYDMELGKLLCAGVDVWLNTPLPPREASGTSGMKAALNGVPSLSVLDGWWIEGHIEDITGWSIGDGTEVSLKTSQELDAEHAAALYQKLADRVLPCFYQEHDRFLTIMRHAITQNGAFFNTQRMVWQYLHNAYRVSQSLT
jgi:starch phosphorylase